jgi:DNA-binding NtrC family response regulator
MVHTILIVDDEINTLKVLSATLKKSNTNVQTARSGEEALDLIKKEKYSLVISDFKMGGMSGEDLLEKVKSVSPDLPFVLLTAHGTIELAVNAMRKGAYTYLTKPVNVNLLESIVGDILLNGPSKVIEADAGMFHYLNIIGKTPAMQEVFLLIKRVSKTDANILILGESGTGKELVARAIHYTSLRADKPFIPIDCTTIPAELNCSASCRKRKYAGLPARTKLMWMSECSLRQTETLRHPWETEIFARIYFTGSM